MSINAVHDDHLRLYAWLYDQAYCTRYDLSQYSVGTLIKTIIIYDNSRQLTHFV